MEKKQSEVTYKIRSAIKKKLAEFSDFVDDELPDYIMILVANQRSKSQIEKDLSLFLRNDTLNFTNWLWDLLDSSKVCTKSVSPTTSKNDPVSIKRGIELDEDAVILEFEPDEHETDFLSYEDTNDSTVSKSSVRPSVLQAKSKEPHPAVTKTRKSEHVVKQKIRRSKSPEKLSKKGNQSYKEPLSSAVIHVKKKINNTEDEYDPTKPEYKSPHKPSSRKYDGAIALQTNKLLLKAVDDAAKSVLNGKNLEEFYKPTPITVLTSKQLSAVENLHKEKKSMHKTIPELKLNPDVSVASELVNEYQSDEEAYRNDQISENTNRTICLRNIPLISNVSEMETVDYDIKKYSIKAFEEEARPKSPHFIVTLDGVSRASFKRKFEDDSVDGMEDDDSDNEDECSTNEICSSPDKKFKLNERCRYWPACKNSDQCFYHHPTVACKCFPACKFGDKCLYIHPNCKFDALCSRKDCPFTHASKRKLPLIAVPMKMEPVKSRRMKVVCKFYPNCASKNCPFIHPKLCRYGTNCRLPACLYGHFPMPTRSQMKWHATLS